MTELRPIYFQDFTSAPDEPIAFRIAPDTFQCIDEIPLDVLVELADMATADLSTKEKFQKMIDLVKDILTPESRATFTARLKVGTEEEPNPHPIGMKAIRKLLPWVMEVYGVRPTQESSESADGSGSTDTSSTDDAFETASTS